MFSKVAEVNWAIINNFRKAVTRTLTLPSILLFPPQLPAVEKSSLAGFSQDSGASHLRSSPEIFDQQVKKENINKKRRVSCKYSTSPPHNYESISYSLKFCAIYKFLLNLPSIFQCHEASYSNYWFFSQYGPLELLVRLVVQWLQSVFLVRLILLP